MSRRRISTLRAPDARAPAWRLTCAVALALSSAGVGAAPGLRTDAAARIFATWATGGGAARPAQQWLVTNCNDDGPGSLRATLTAATSAATLDLRGLTCGVIRLTSGALEVQADDIRIIGPGAALLAIDGGGTDRILLDGHDNLSIAGLTLQNGADRTTGFHVAGGGCVAAAGHVTLVASVVTGCLAAGEGAYGGALYAYAVELDGATFSANRAYGYLPGTGTAANGGAIFAYQATLTDSTLHGNTAAHFSDEPRSHYDVGGALMVVRGAAISGSTLDHNVADTRGGAINSLGDVTISNSTLAGNATAGGRGGAVYMRAPARLILDNVTISGNTATSGGGLHLASGSARLVSSIVAGNAAADGADVAATQPITIDGDHNLVGPGRGAAVLPADTVPGPVNLQPLTDNGGPTRTMLPGLGSAAIDAGSNPLALDFDQRGDGYARSIGAAPDIGAVEAALPQPAAPVPASRPMWLVLLASLLAVVAWRRPRRRA